MTVSAVEQFELGTTPSLLMGSGTVYGILNVTGLGMVGVASSDIPLLNATAGVYAARDRLGGRTVSLDLVIRDSSAMMTSLTALATAWQSTNTDVHLTYRLTGQAANRYVVGRPRRFDFPWKVGDASRGVVFAHCDFFCQNPAIHLSADDSVIVL